MKHPELAAYASLLTQVQGLLLERCLSQGDQDVLARRVLTRRTGAFYQDLVVRLAPRHVIEIGAHEAEFSRFVKRNRPEARVVAFEANPEVFAAHADAVRAAGVEFVHKAVAAEDGVLSFHVPFNDQPRLTMGSLMRDSRAEGHDTYEIEGTRLDSFLGDAAGSNAIWIDVEGAVGTILKGAGRALSACLALYVELETRQRWGDQALADDVVAQLATYDLVPVVRDVQRRHWQFNAIFLRSDVLARPEILQLCRTFLTRQVRAASPRA